MNNAKSPQDYIDAHPQWRSILEKLRSLLLSTELEECIKWGIPTYCIKGKNVVGLSAFNSYAGLWFFNGALLKDDGNELLNAQEGKTQAMRQLRFKAEQELNDAHILGFIQQAIDNQKAGLVIKAKLKKPLEVPPELRQSLLKDTDLDSKFAQLGLSKQREYTEYIISAKRDATKQTRLKKIIPMIRQGIGLNDKYR
jgi:uncharacterized protein YdeI (YjbR/CyaY-like superfamily)